LQPIKFLGDKWELRDVSESVGGKNQIQTAGKKAPVAEFRFSLPIRGERAAPYALEVTYFEDHSLDTPSEHRWERNDVLENESISNSSFLSIDGKYLRFTLPQLIEMFMENRKGPVADGLSFARINATTRIKGARLPEACDYDSPAFKKFLPVADAFIGEFIEGSLNDELRAYFEARRLYLARKQITQQARDV
jgi:hypothetical protein